MTEQIVVGLVLVVATTVAQSVARRIERMTRPHRRRKHARAAAGGGR